MEGFNLKECTEFDEWQDLKRENIRQKFGQILQILSTTYASQLLWKQAIALAQRWVGLDHLHEPAQRQLINLYADSGERSAALHQFEELGRLLRDQLGQEPEQETLELYQRIRGKEEARRKIEPPERLNLYPILKTKLFIPASPANRVKRLDLVHQLYNIERKALTIISAPAGYGKTALLAEWLSETPLPAAWLSLDHGDNDPFVFLMYFIASLESIHEDVGLEARQLITSSQPAPHHTILASLLNDLLKITKPYALVLDDYQFISEPAVHEVVGYILDHLPPNLHVVISTRSDPPIQLGRLRTNDQLLEIRTQDLRFNTNEVEDFLNSVMHLGLSQEDIKKLEHRTEGWVVGLKMAALSLQGRTAPSVFIQAFSGSQRYVLEYLMEEVMKMQPLHVQDFLMETSILESMTGPLCDALLSEELKSSGESGQSILEYLEISNLFLIPQDENKQWYRYHHLFADLLKLRLTRYSVEKVAALHQRASLWYETEGRYWDAISHAIAASDYQRAADLIEKIASFSLPLGTNYVTLKKCIDQLPKELVMIHPWICVTLAYVALSQSNPTEVEEWLQRAEKAVHSLHGIADLQQLEEIQNNIVNIRTYGAFESGDFAQAITHADQLLQKQHTLSNKLRGQLNLAVGEIYLTAGEFTKCIPFLRQAWNIGIQNPDLVWFTRTAFRLGIVLKIQGKLSEAKKVCQDSLKLVRDAGFTDSSVLGRSEICLGDILRERGEVETAERLLTDGLRHLLLQDQAVDIIFGYLYISRLERDKGNSLRALELLTKADQLFTDNPLLDVIRNLWDYNCVPLWIILGNWKRLADWQNQRKLDPNLPLTYWNEVQLLALARVLIAQGEINEALKLLTRLEPVVEAGGRNTRLIEICNLSALGLFQQGNHSEAFTHLKKGLDFAESEGFRQIFLDEGEKMRQLIRMLPTTDLTPRLIRYINSLLV